MILKLHVLLWVFYRFFPPTAYSPFSDLSSSPAFLQCVVDLTPAWCPERTMSENIFVRAFGSVGVLHVVMCIYMASTCTLTFVPKHNFFLYFLSEANTVSIRVFEKK